MSEIEPQVVTVGTHEFEFVPPDLLRFTFRGNVTADETVTYLDFIYANIPEGNGSLYAAYDLSELTRLDEQSRKRLGNVSRPYPFDGVVVVGASYSMRVLSEMLIRAIKIIKPEYWQFPHRFMGSMAEGDAWFEELRKKTA